MTKMRLGTVANGTPDTVQQAASDRETLALITK